MPTGRGDRGAESSRGSVRARSDPLRPVTVDFPVSAERAFAYLADPINRPQWQASLRAIEQVHADAWTDVTFVPGLRPRMRTTLSISPQRWAESGRWGPFAATLDLRFVSVGTEHCRVGAEFSVQGLGLPAHGLG